MMECSRRVRQFITMLAVLAAGSVLAAGCGGDDEADVEATQDASAQDASAPAATEPPRVALLAALIDKAYTPVQAAGIKDATGGPVKIFSANLDPQKQLKQCEDAVTSGRYDGIVMTPLDNTSALPCLKTAAAANIPVVIDQTAVGPDRNKLTPQVEGVVGSVLYPPQQNATMTYEIIQRACEGIKPCKVVVELSFVSDPLFADTLKYLQDKAETGAIDVVANYESQYDPAQTTTKLRDVLTAHRDVNVVTFANDNNALAGIRVIEDLGLSQQIKTVGSGGTEGGVKAIADGTLFATIAAYPFTASKRLGEMVVAAVKGETIAEPGLSAFDVGPLGGIITKDNVSEFEPEWGAG